MFKSMDQGSGEDLSTFVNRLLENSYCAMSSFASENEENKVISHRLKKALKTLDHFPVSSPPRAPMHALNPVDIILPLRLPCFRVSPE